ncbi:hypothetical protein LTR56_013650 [Elasticomyces elasticus]|nr:hypothetical protein LTR22_023716 [Elasticomyces elasticus]KAK3637477.1 hypothetical protein LTR56_013650 [Elasticomyces elasticus]KAK4917863.1 hypothetical protein LTR49_014267 [Elasticomyces elasticus]KAK5757022.1 hypothetical protein LTS12_012836 [Elasticomyces elasticus]
MDNSQFRKLVFDTPARKNDGSPTARPGATPAFGAKRSSFMPMTPRTVKGDGGVDFARQVRERNAALQPTKKFKTSHAPKGAKFAKGYTDRARAREEADDDGDDKAERIKALEEQMKLGQISMEMFENLRDTITGGDASSTHLVKGLDRKLLERVKRGEDVLGVGGVEAVEPAPNVEEELDKLGEQEVTTVQREKAEKKGMMAPPPLAGKKRNRDEIMAELKAQRAAAKKAKATPALDSRWRKVGEKQKSRIEVDHKGREVRVTVDEDGVVKRMVRKVPARENEEEADTVQMPDASKPILGADAEIPEPALQPVPHEEEEEDIFEGVGTEYNPLGNEPDDEDSDEDSDLEAAQVTAPLKEPSRPIDELEDSEDDGEVVEDDEEPPRMDEESAHSKPAEAVEPSPNPGSVRRSYFKETAEETASTDHFAGIENVLKKAAKLNQPSEESDIREGETEEAHQVRLKRRAQMLAQQDRDMEDMDMGFGSSRVEDEAEADEDGKKVKLFEWKQSAGGDDDEGEGDGKGREKKKRKPKKRKGDVNSAADIMKVIEGRKTGGK